MTKKLNVLIVEDEEDDCKGLVQEIQANADKLCLVGVLKSSNEALTFIREHSPHAVILDLELQEGTGDGMDLLDKLRSTVLSRKPYIVINTNSASKVTRDTAKMMGADYTFAKWQKGYTHKMVINQLLFVMPKILGGEAEPPAPLSKAQLENKMRDFVQNIFNRLGLSVKHAGYGYLVDAVIMAAKGENDNWEKTIGDKIGKSEDSVKHAMQYAINYTWEHGDINAIAEIYTAPLHKDKVAPTVIEFVFFFKQKLITYLNE